MSKADSTAPRITAASASDVESVVPKSGTQRGLPPKLGLDRSDGSSNNEKREHYFWVHRPEPYPSRPEASWVGRTLHKLKDGADPSNFSKEDLEPAVLGRNVIVQPKTGEAAEARMNGLVADGASNMVLVLSRTEANVPELYLAAVEQHRAGCFTYTKKTGIYSACKSLEPSAGFVDKGHSAAQTATKEASEELGLEGLKSYVLIDGNIHNTAPALTGVQHQHRVSLYMHDSGNVTDLMADWAKSTQRSKTEIATRQQARLICITDLPTLLTGASERSQFVSAGVTAIKDALGMHLRHLKKDEIELSAEDKLSLVFSFPKSLADGTGTAPKYSDETFWTRLQSAFYARDGSYPEPHIKPSKPPTEHAKL